MTELVFVVPGRLDQLTGGYLYDRHIIDGLRSRGHAVKVIELSPNDRETALAELADGTTAAIDGLALPGLEQAVYDHWRRLRLVALVHHPLAEETGLSRAAAERITRFEAAALQRFRRVVCPSARTAAGVEAYGIPSERICVVPPGTAKPDRPLRSRRSPVRSLLCVASLIPRKGHRVLVAALARLRGLDWQMLCIGSLDRHPRTARSIRQMISAARLGRRITLAGEQPPRMVMRAYRAADLFVLPSLHEGYGMAFAEAMAHGLPIVATAAGAIPETVPREAGLLVRPGDAAGLARALWRVIADPALAVRLAAGSRAAGARLPDWRQATELWEQALDLPVILPPRPSAL
ncbi:MAG TPA: glycosyltransferase family 4 protein [Stellaceae bacterium]|jgi:glycosyltransferase involved in cell wall biosynthesis|nr:glycosyltransferase family 4 protein [Stellaceae bacterium]